MYGHDHIAGGTLDFDLRKAEAQAASIEADVPSYQISYTQSVNRLAISSGGLR